MEEDEEDVVSTTMSPSKLSDAADTACASLPLRFDPSTSSFMPHRQASIRKLALYEHEERVDVSVGLKAHSVYYKRAAQGDLDRLLALRQKEGENERTGGPYRMRTAFAGGGRSSKQKMVPRVHSFRTTVSGANSILVLPKWQLRKMARRGGQCEAVKGFVEAHSTYSK